MTAGLGPSFPSKTDSILFLDETGTGNYFNGSQLAAWQAAESAGKKAPFPILFALAGALFRRSDYTDFDRKFRVLKTKHFGNDKPLHEYDIRRLRLKRFKVLRDPARWLKFYADLKALFDATPFKLIIVTFHKPQMQIQYLTPSHPYKYALEVILERVVLDRPWCGNTCRIVAESRFAGLNNELTQELLRLQLFGGGSNIIKAAFTVSAEELRRTFDPNIVFRQKTDNDSGLQVADLAAGPLARYVYGLDVGEPRSVRKILEVKLRRSHAGKSRGYGFMCFPQGYPPSCPIH